MSHLERSVHISHQLYRIRDTARSCYGAHYRCRVQPCMEIIEAVAKSEGASVLTVGRHMAKETSAAGDSPLLVLAAMVELLEPTLEVPRA